MEIVQQQFDATALERIKLNYDEVKAAIYKSKNQKDMANMLHCGTDKLRTYLNESGLYKEYCDVHNVPYKPQQQQRICSVCGETKNVRSLHGVLYCKRHYLQMYRHGKIFANTIYDFNEYVEDGDIIRIILKDKDQNYKCESIIDKEDYEKVCKYKWYESAGYCITKGIDPNNGIDIGNVIFNNYEVKFDHQNHDRLNNCKSNLRPVSSHENSMNMGKKNTNTSGVTGVQRQNPQSPRWTANITYNYKPIWLGVDENFDKVVCKRLIGEAQYFKEFSPNYNREKNLICLQYTSQTDKLQHYVEVDLSGNVVTNIIVKDEEG